MNSKTILILLSVLIILAVGLFIISRQQTTTAPTIVSPTSMPVMRVSVTPEPSSVATGGAVIKE